MFIFPFPFLREIAEAYKIREKYTYQIKASNGRVELIEGISKKYRVEFNVLANWYLYVLGRNGVTPIDRAQFTNLNLPYPKDWQKFKTVEDVHRHFSELMNPHLLKAV